MAARALVIGVLVLGAGLGGCAGGSGLSRREPALAMEEGGGGGDSISPRIVALIARGQFTEAQILIQESVKSGLLPQATATALLARIQLLNTRLGEIPARLQRVANFPAVLKDRTLHQIINMLEQKDYSVATQAQLMTAKKLIEQSPRLMEKVP